ncbi:MAG: methylcobamide--CoM methyltransferase [Elusimicrobia bacterium]|nr:methylcobamide--CoM methyltransferase [Elusimicrobiota bacterium]
MIFTVVGNYPKIPNAPRPAKLRQAITRFQGGELTQAELARVEGEVTEEVIREQEAVGLDLLTDGHIRWEDPATYFARGIDGFEISGLIRYFDTNVYYRQPVVTRALGWKGPITVKDLQFAKRVTNKPIKAVITGPFTLARMSRNTHYSTLEALVMDLAKILRQEALALQAAGAAWIQFDEPWLVRAKQDFPIVQRAYTVLTEGLTTKQTLLCTYFGDVQGLPPAFFKLPVGGFGLDFVTTTGNFDLLKRQAWPKDKWLAGGIVDARNTRMQNFEELERAFGQLTAVLPAQQLHISPHCGLEFLPREVAYAKLEQMVKSLRQGVPVL